MQPATNREASSPVMIGEVISGKFRVERVLGSGGNGVVFLATHLHLDERVALKFLTGETAAKVAEGARATVKLRSDHVARVLDIGRHRERPYIVMEYLEGKDLEALVRESGRLEDVGEAVELILQACEAIAEAHRAGVVHRDIKLANIFLIATRTGLPRVKVLDFGIARLDALGGSPTESTGSGKTFGTPHYIAPERLLGIDDDPRSDLWSLGIALFELVSGHKPFQSRQTVSLIAEILEREHASLISVRDDVPLKLSAIIDRCLAKDPELRFQSAGELAGALAPLAPVRAQVHVERALEYGRPPPPPSSTPSIESARRTLADSSRALQASRATGGGSTRPSGAVTGTGSRKARSAVTLGLWALAAIGVVGGVIYLSTIRTPALREPVALDPSGASTGAIGGDPGSATVNPVSVPSTPAAAATTMAAAKGIAAPVWHGSPSVKGAATASASAAPVTTPATTSSSKRPALETNPWKPSAVKPKMEENPFN